MQLTTGEREQQKQQNIQEHTVADRAVKNSAKTYKENFIEDIAKEAEDASAQDNMTQLYDITRKLAGKYKHTDRPIKDKNGNVLTSVEDQLKRWREHFEELLNRPPPQNPPDIAPAEEVLQINCESPSKTEIEKAIHHTKRGKVSSPDTIPAEAIKATLETSRYCMIYSGRYVSKKKSGMDLTWLRARRKCSRFRRLVGD